MALIWRNFNFRIYPNQEQEQRLALMFACNRFIYNHFVALGRKQYASSGRYPSLQENQRALPDLVNRHDFLQEADPTSLSLALDNLEQAYYCLAWKEDNKPPRFKSYNDGKQSYMLKCLPGTRLIANNKIHLPSVGAVKLAEHRTIMRCYRPYYVTVIRKPSRQYEVSIAMGAPDHLLEREMLQQNKRKPAETRPLHEKESIKIRSIGLDFSMPDLIIASNGHSAKYPHYYKKQLKKLAGEQRKLAKCRRGSRNYTKQRIRVARQMQQCADQRKDFQHKLSRHLASRYDLVCIEDIAIKQLIRKTKLGKSAYDDGWYQFVQMLDYKLKESGKHLQKVGRYFPSTRLCSQCGHIAPKVKLSERTYHCSCGYTESRDINAAINIRKEGERLYLKNQHPAQAGKAKADK